MRQFDRKNQLALTGVLLAFVVGLSGAALAEGPASFDEALALAKREAHRIGPNQKEQRLRQTVTAYCQAMTENDRATQSRDPS